jgi:hypothetical protein
MVVHLFFAIFPSDQDFSFSRFVGLLILNLWLKLTTWITISRYNTHTRTKHTHRYIGKSDINLNLLLFLFQGCGFGCQLHHIVYCLIFAYATERTLILNSKGWRYNNKGWDYVFHPISDSCTTAYDDKVIQWPGEFQLYLKALKIMF